MKLRNMFKEVATMAGIFLVIGGMWLSWDLLNTVQRYVDMPRFMAEFKFYAPFFVYTWDYKNWTAPFDLGLTLVGIGVIVLILRNYAGSINKRFKKE